MIIHDNAKTFKARNVKQFLVQNEIKQRFILPVSPWWGGFYERLVRSVKLSLRKSLGKSLLTYEEMETMLCNMEAVINSRPLTYISNDDLQEVLTPFHLLFGHNVIHNSVDVVDTSDSVHTMKRLIYLKNLLGKYWKIFVSVYLSELRQAHLYRREKSQSKKVLKLNDIVLIKDETAPRYKWKLGKVEELIILLEFYFQLTNTANIYIHVHFT